MHIIFKSLFKNECFPDEWKKENVVPENKKGNKELLNNYRSVPLTLSIISLILYLDTNSLLNNNQSGFGPNDSCVCYLFLIKHDTYKTFEANPSVEVREIS